MAVGDLPLPAPRVTLWGATGEVTGSMHQVFAAGQNLLLDCGLVMEKTPEARTRNARFPFSPHKLDAVLLSHAHLDHSGNLPNLVRQGFCGPIYCTRSTRDLLAAMLPDSARIQEEAAYRLNALRQRNEAWVEPLYTQRHVEETFEQIRTVEFAEPLALARGLSARFLPAGHVLGSAIIHLEEQRGATRHRLGYTADLGRPELPLHPPPAALPECNLLLCESTYGGQVHEPWEQMLEALRVLALRTTERGGKLLIPAFSLGRTQLLVFALQQLERTGRLPHLPIFVDSPLAVSLSQVYRQYFDELAEPLRQLYQNDAGAFLKGEKISYLRTPEESKTLNDFSGPAIIIAASGMSEGGRVIHHLRRLVDDPRCTILLVSFQAEGTLGSRLLQPGPTVRIHGKDFNKWADIVALRGFSAHADQPVLLAKLGELDSQCTEVVLVHGEPRQAEALRGELQSRGWNRVSLGRLGVTHEW